MGIGTFGSSNQYKMLIGLMVEVEQLPYNDKKYTLSIIHKFNEKINLTNNIVDSNYRNYILLLIQQDYITKLDRLEGSVQSFFKNFITAKIRNSQNDFTQHT